MYITYVCAFGGWRLCPLAQSALAGNCQLNSPMSLEALDALVANPPAARSFPDAPRPPADPTARRAPCAPLLHSMPSEADIPATMIPIGLKIHLTSRCLAALPPAKRMTSIQISEWTAALDIEATVLREGLDALEGDRNDEAALLLTNAAISALALPSSSLAPIMGLKKAHDIVRVEVEKAQCGPDIHIAPINLGPPPPVDSTVPFLGMRKSRPLL